MIIASRIPYVTDQMLAATLRATEASARGADWMLVAEVERLERRLESLLRRIGTESMVERRAA